MKVAVIGAGVAGMTAAYELVRGGAEVEVFEASGAVGGMARSIDLWGQRVDLGPHRFFSKDPRVSRLWHELAGDDFRMVDRITRIYYRGRLFRYPLRAGNALWNMGIPEALRCTASYFRQKAVPSRAAEDEPSFESWVVEKFGRRLFQMFFKSYSEKLWGIPCREIDADFAAQRIKRFSLGEAFKNAVRPGNGNHQTLCDRFAYPTGGSGMIYRRMARLVRNHGGRIHLNTPVRRVLDEPVSSYLITPRDGVLYRGRRAVGVELDDGRRREFDQVVSTMPLSTLVGRLRDVPANVGHAARSLTYRNTLLVYLEVDRTDLFPDQWLYVHSPDLLTGRITNFRNWVPELYGNADTSILALEYWCDGHDALWSQPQRVLIERAKHEARAAGLIGNAALRRGHVIRLPRSYPVYRRGYKRHLAQITPFLDRLSGLTVIGRYGAFKYNNQDHSILMGILAAENILHGRQHNLWTLNTDYHEYQESAASVPRKQAA